MMLPIVTLVIIAQLGAAEALNDPAPPMIWLESARNEPHCDWYLSGRDLLRMASEERHQTFDGCEFSLRLRGNLNPAGADYFADVSDALAGTTASPRTIILDSRGGEADAAFAIAERIRSLELYRRNDGGVATEIADDDTAVCFSACLFVFAAGFERHAEFNIFGDPRLASRMGLHRPARMSRRTGDFDSDRTSAAMRRTESRMRRYFESVGVDTRIVDDMFAVPFNEIHLITRDEARAYGLVGDTRAAD